MEKIRLSNTVTRFEKGKEIYFPVHNFVKSCQFTKQEEANLVDAIATIGEINGLSNNDIQHLISPILRMLKSDSEWSK